MDSTEGLFERLGVALNEGDVAGVRAGLTPRAMDVLVHVHALPSEGPVDPDIRRLLRFEGVGEVAFLLRRTRTDGYDRPRSVGSLEEIEEFFASLVHQDTMYGWRFFDDPNLTEDWPTEVSLRLNLGESASHVFYWFSECWPSGGAQRETYLFEGTIAFEQLGVFRANGTEMELEDFCEAGERWWQGLHGEDPRVSSDAQQHLAAHALRWRGPGSTSFLVSG